MGIANVALYAKWSANIDTITFNKNDRLAGGVWSIDNCERFIG